MVERSRRQELSNAVTGRGILNIKKSDLVGVWRAMIPIFIVVAAAFTFLGCQNTQAPDVHEQAAKRIFREQCAACHALGGQGSRSSMAMDHEGANRTEEWIKVQITHPEKHNPSTAMPQFPPDRISKSDLTDLAHYLASLK